MAWLRHVDAEYDSTGPYQTTDVVGFGGVRQEFKNGGWSNIWLLRWSPASWWHISCMAVLHTANDGLGMTVA